MIGRTLSHYKVLEKIGEGGMGEVYLAEDTKLDREVAVKVLPATFAENKERLARFEREARLLASLNHPNIAAIFELEESDGVRFLALEYVPGETLADRIKRGPIPVDETLPLFKQIAEGLEAAHEKGVIHRDLKPANIKVTPEGKIKVLDFGLAKAMVGEEPALDASQSPTLTKDTALGAILGTAAYMSPEQARGKPVDKRTDNWAFGCCLFEAVTGRQAFEGETVTDIFVAIINNEPDWEALPSIGKKLQDVLRRCLVKSPSQRLRDIGDARIEIGEVIDEPEVNRKEDTRTRKSSKLVTLGALVGVLIGTIFGSWLWRNLGPTSVDRTTPSPVTRSVIELSPEAPLALGSQVPTLGYDILIIDLSPDGTELVFVGSSAEGNRLYRRGMDSFEVSPISGTEGAIFPFFSPDGRWVGFLTNDKVKKVSLQGGAPMTLCDANTPIRADWVRDDAIYFSEHEGLVLSRVSAAGGPSSEVVSQSSEDTRFSEVLPDGRSALFTKAYVNGISADYGSVLLLSLETLETKTLIESGYDPRYVSPGYLLFARSGDLLAVRLDLERLEVQGEPVTVVSGAAMDSFFVQAQVTLSENGLLAYVPGGDCAMGRLAWVDRRGTAEFLPVSERLYGVVDLAPGGRQLAVHVADVNDYIWIYDIPRQEGRRVAATGHAGWPVWADAETISFRSWRPDGAKKIHRQRVDEPGSLDELFSGQLFVDVGSWSPDGRVVEINDVGARMRMGFLTVGSGQEPEWLSGADSNRWGGVFSPDGEWVAYSSDETGRYEIWIRSFPDGDVIRQISVDGGIEPVWCWECGELFYRRGNQWFSTRVSLQPELSWEPPRLAFETDFVDTPGRSYDVSPDGERLLVVKRTREPTRMKIHIVTNWFEELNRLVPTN